MRPCQRETGRPWRPAQGNRDEMRELKEKGSVWLGKNKWQEMRQKDSTEGVQEQRNPSENTRKILPYFWVFLVQNTSCFSESVHTPRSSGEMYKKENVPQLSNHVNWHCFFYLKDSFVYREICKLRPQKPLQIKTSENSSKLWQHFYTYPLMTPENDKGKLESFKFLTSNKATSFIFPLA